MTEPGDTEPNGVRLGRWARRRRDGLRPTQAEVLARMAAHGAAADANALSRLERGGRRHLPAQPLFSALCRALEAHEADALRAAGLLPGAAGDPPAGLDALVAGLSEGQRATVRRMVRDAAELAKGGW